ncbi:GGDEF domain-containing protein [Ningiella sp. W23]|uniref:GGDEF domain-containing protein n=1 Tax=Ningiella sp. W23 TaxID=3023715 RepID=UPI003757F996
MNPDRSKRYFDTLERSRMMAYVVISAFVHVVFLGYCLALSIPLLIGFNAFALALWLYSIVLVRKNEFRRVIVITTVMFLCQITFMTIVFGTEHGIHMGIWPLACLFAINPRVPVISCIVFSLVCVLTFLSLHLYAPLDTEYHFISGTREILLLVFGGLLVSGVMSMKRSFHRRRNQLIHIANHDALTGLKNRRFFTTFIEYQRQISIREKRSFCIAMGDIDHFKLINDKHGHQTGDRVLQAVAKCFERILAQSDVICRWGGEEFIIYLPERDVKAAMPVVEAIREVISQEEIDGIKVTMSFGLIQTKGSQSFDEALQQADELLYTAKATGRNKVEYHAS